MSDNETELTEPGWPEEGGRPFARGEWANIGPFNYRGNRFLRIAAKTAAVLVICAFLVSFGFGVYFVISELRGGPELSPSVPAVPAEPAGP